MGQSGSAQTGAQLIDLLQSNKAVDRHAVMIAMGGCLRHLARQKALPEALQARAQQALLERASGADNRLAARAIDSLMHWHPQQALADFAKLLRQPSRTRRSQIAWALSAFPGKTSRDVLHFVTRQASTEVMTSAVAALGEVGTARDLPVLVRAARRRHWPIPGAAAYAMARLAQRGLLKKHASHRTLCELSRSREPYVRANLAAAFAALGAGPCKDGPHPAQWLEPTHAPAVRAAAARWLWAAAQQGEIDPQQAQRILAECAQRDLEPQVAQVCRNPQTPPGEQQVSVYAYAADNETLLRRRLVGLRLSNGAVFVGFTDENAQVRLPQASTGPLLLEDPGQLPLDP